MEQGETVYGDYLGHTAATKDSDFAFLGALFDIHVFEFAGLEDLAAFFAFDELRFFIPADDLHAGVLARLLRITALGRSGRLWSHKYGRFPVEQERGPFSPEFPVF
jgi:hypothetical protein